MLTDAHKLKAVGLKGELTTAAGRAAVVELKKEVQRTGATARELAAALGVHESTLCRWEREVRAPRGRGRPTQESSSGGGSGFRMVRVAPAETGAVTAQPASFGLRVAHAPSGLVIDGLDVETLAALLRRLS